MPSASSSSPSAVPRSLLVFVAVALAPVLFVGLAARAAEDWRLVGATARGDEVLVSAVNQQKNGTRTAWVRVEYKDPEKLPQGGPFEELRARVRFDCAHATATPTSEWFYSRDKGGKLVVSKKGRHDDQFGSAAEGGFGGMTRDFVCQQK